MAVVDAGRRRHVDGDAALSDDDTIVALSSGQPPAAIAIVRMSGSRAMAVASSLAGALPPPRQAGLRALHDVDGNLLDRALVLVFPGPASATGEDLVELHCHGGRAVVAAVERALVRPGVRLAMAGEFTRRALLNGRVDLAQAQGLADLLGAETEMERRQAVLAVEGEVSRLVRDWMDRLTGLAADVEASIDFADEGDVAAGMASMASIAARQHMIAMEIEAVLAAPPVERWREGWRVVVAGPPNAGKSTLVNLLSQRDAAIVSPQAGTTRDRIEVSVQREGVGYTFVDTAGLRDATDDAIERAGIGRAEAAMASADLLLWLDTSPPPSGRLCLRVHARADLPQRRTMPSTADIAVRQDEPGSIASLWTMIVYRLRDKMALASVSLHRDERERCREALKLLQEPGDDEVLIADRLHGARRALSTILGVDAVEQLLDNLFARFCVGK